MGDSKKRLQNDSKTANSSKKEISKGVFSKEKIINMDSKDEDKFAKKLSSNTSKNSK